MLLTSFTVRRFSPVDSTTNLSLCLIAGTALDFFLKGVFALLDEYLAAAASRFLWSDHPQFVKQVNDACRTWITKAKFELDKRRGSLAFFDDQFNRLFQHRVGFGKQFAPGEAALPGADAYRLHPACLDLLVVPCLPVIDHTPHFFIRNMAALNTAWACCVTRQIKHVTLAKQIFRADRIQNDT